MRLLIRSASACAVLAGCGVLSDDLGLPPATIDGSLGYIFQTRHVPDQPREWAHYLTASLYANTYVWEPWFATAEGTVRFTQEKRSGGIAGDDTTFVSGDLTVTALPASRYPTTLSYARSDSRLEGSTAEFNVTTDRVALTSYLFLPDDWTVTLSGAYQHADFSDGDDDRVTTADLSVKKLLGSHDFRLLMRYQDAEFSPADAPTEKDEVLLAGLQHLYRPSVAFNMESQATLLRTRDVTQRVESDAFSIQGIGTARWAPRESLFTVSAALRAFFRSLELENRAVNGAAFMSDTTLVSGVVSANYPFNDRLTASAGVTAEYQSNDSEVRNMVMNGGDGSMDRHSVGALAGLNYFSEPLSWRSFEYSWTAGALAQVKTGSEEISDEVLSANLGHVLSRTVDVPWFGPVYGSISQTGRASYLSSEDPLFGLTHTLLLTREFGHARGRTHLQVTATDSREFGEREISQQLASAQISRYMSVDPDTDWQAGMSLQAYRIEIDGLDSGWRYTASGTAGYTARDIFNVDDLVFRSTLTLQAIGYDDALERRRQQRLEDDLQSQWSNRLDYRIGQLFLGLEGRVTWDDDGMGDLVRFQVRRVF